MSIRVFLLFAFALLSGCAGGGPDGPSLLEFREVRTTPEQSTVLQDSYEAAAKCWTKPDGQFAQFELDESKTVRKENVLDLTFVYRDAPENTALRMQVLTGSIIVIQGFGPEREGPFGKFIHQIHKDSRKTGVLKLCQSDS